MPINTNMVGIRPVTTERPTREPDSIQRRDEGAVSGFRPQTNVALRTAINDLAGTLGRIATSERFGINKVPSEVSQIIKNILEQSLSLQETIGKGIGSTIESQRFSMDQLSTFGRMLFQLGSLSDRGFLMRISPETQVLLSQLKNLVVSTEGGNALEPVLMSKAAFELLDSKNPEQLPKALYEILSQLSKPFTTTQFFNQPQEDPGIMDFLNKFVKFFMPRPAADNPQHFRQHPQPQQQPQQNFQQPLNQQMPNQNFRQPMNQQMPNQNFRQPMNQQTPNQNFQQPMNQQMPNQQYQQQPMNQQMPNQNFQQPMNQQMPNQNFQQPMNQQMPN
ncbi:MAG: hypothetical protein IJT06_01060, partial [Selenomonadaceae bacterium]|nr:hypothetical protein [Selenomonadaceae bacterium]